MLLASKLEHYIQSHAQYIGIDRHYINSYSTNPNSNTNDVSHLVMRINEIDDTPRDYGSNHSIDRVANVQIQIFIPYSFTGDVTTTRERLLDLMEDRNWACTMDSGVADDPSADVRTNTTRWRKTHKRL